MKIEIGKKYTLHNRPDVDYVMITGMNKKHKYSSRFYKKGVPPWLGITYTEDGLWIYDINTPQNTDIIAEYKVTSPGDTLDKIIAPLTVAEAEKIYPTSCNHKYVNVGFASITMAYKFCGRDK